MDEKTQGVKEETQGVEEKTHTTPEDISGVGRGWSGLVRVGRG